MIIKGIGFCVIALLLAGSILARAEEHAFVLKDGRALEAEVVGCNAKLDQVELKLESGKRVKVKPDIFVEADQQYIKEWATLDGFRSPSLFKVQCDKKKLEQWKDENDAFQTKFERFVYQVGLENRNAYAIENLKIEYRIFYEQEENDSKHELVTSQLLQPGTLDIDRLWAREKRTLNTESIVLKEFEFNMTDYYFDNGDPESTTGEIKGIWIRMTIKTPSGQTAVREIFEPTGIEGKYAWPESVAPPPPKEKKKKK